MSPPAIQAFRQHRQPRRCKPLRRMWLTLLLLWVAGVVGTVVGTVAGAGQAAAARPDPADWPPQVLQDTHGQVRLHFEARDRVLAEQLWPLVLAGRDEMTDRLRLYPEASLDIVLAPTDAAFATLVGAPTAEVAVGVYMLGQGLIVLRTPRATPGGRLPLASVLRHELAHAVLDQGLRTPVPLWLHEGLALLLSQDLDYLDEARLSVLAVTGRLIPLSALMHHYPTGHGGRDLAYAQSAAFARYLLRRDGMGGVQRLLAEMERNSAGDGSAEALPTAAFQSAYGASLPELEADWRNELTRRFSWFTLITSTSVLGGLGVPLLLLAYGRRWWQRMRVFRAWDREEAQRATLVAPAFRRGDYPPRHRLRPGSAPRQTDADPESTGEPAAAPATEQVSEPGGKSGNGSGNGRSNGSASGTVNGPDEPPERLN